MYAIQSEWRFSRHPQLPTIKVIGKVCKIPGINIESYMLGMAAKIIELAMELDGFVFQPLADSIEDICEEAEKGKYILTFFLDFNCDEKRDAFYEKISEELFPY